jgi:hypothetical protein
MHREVPDKAAVTPPAGELPGKAGRRGMNVTAEQVALTTRYLGLTLRNPLVAAASPVTGRLDTLRRLDDAGVGAVVLPSLFEEQIEHDELALTT